MDGTVNWARRDDGRPAFAGTAAGAGAAETLTTVGVTDMDLISFVAAAVEADLAGDLTTGFATGLTGVGDLATGLATAFAAALTAGLTADLTAGWVTGFAIALVAGFADFTATALTGVLLTAFAGAFATVLPAGLTGVFTGVALALAGLATGFVVGLTAAGTLLLAVLALVSFPDIAFTSFLLAGLAWAWSVGTAFPSGALEALPGGVSPARECTGFPNGKPISCKIETIIWHST
jgi:hypothetical protein